VEKKMDNRRKLEFFAFLVMIVGGILLADLYLAQEGLAQAPSKVEPAKATVPFTQELLDQLGSAKVAMDTVWTLVGAISAHLICGIWGTW
jgi:Tfp pilus assembly protein PilN